MSATYTVKQVADILGYSTNSIYTFLKEKRLKGVRVGKGRFRIPQVELDRLLGPQPRQLEQMAPISQPPVQSVSSYPNNTPLQVRSYVLADIRVDVPSLFNWFIGIASIILGLTMYLFSKGYEEFSISQFSSFLPLVRVSLVAGGFGILLSDVVGKRKSVWHKIFHTIITFVYAAYTVILFQLGNSEGVAIFGSTVFSLVIYTALRLDGVAGFALHVGSLALAITLVGIAWPEASGIAQLFSSMPLPIHIVQIVWMVCMVLFAVIVSIGYRKNSVVFRLGMVAVSIMLIALAFYFAKNLLWGRSFYVLLLGLLSFFVPVWQSLTFAHKRDRMFVFGAFGSILSLFIIAVGAVRIMQTNIVSYAGNELENKVMYGKLLLESTFQSAQSTLSSLAESPLLREGFEKNKKDVLLHVIKNVFESNSTIRKIVLLSKEKAVVSVYPYAETETGSYSVRDYIVRAESTKKTVMSDAFEALSDNSKRKSVVIAVPVLDSSNAVIGMVVGYVDIDSVGNKLQQIVSAKLGEQFVVLDRSGKYVIHQDTSMIGIDLDSSDEAREARQEEYGVVREESSSSSRSIVVYEEVDGQLGWVIGATTPVMSILQVTPTATLTLFAITSISLLIVSVFLMSHRVKHAASMVDSEYTIHTSQISGTTEHSADRKQITRSSALMQKKHPKKRSREDSS